METHVHLKSRVKSKMKTNSIKESGKINEAYFLSLVITGSTIMVTHLHGVCY